MVILRNRKVQRSIRHYARKMTDRSLRNPVLRTDPPVAPGENRADRRYCSDRCRIRAYRQRKARACARRAAGVNVRKGAQELDTHVAMVTDWVGES